MVRLFFDIETLPASEEKKKEYLEILRKKGKNGSGSTSDEDLYLKTSRGVFWEDLLYRVYKGKLEDICKYCMKDVELTRKVYYKMIFEEIVPDSAEEVDDLPF